MSNDVTVRNSGWEMDQRLLDVVVISSQVAYGAVGNTATARVLTEAGYRCVQIPTILLGTLPHYSTVHGGAIPDEWLSGILDDLLKLEALSDVKYVLVGYLAHPGQAKIIADWFSRLRAEVPYVQLVVDPAMGDDDVGMYTDPAVAESYSTQLVPLASGLTPNRYELSLLAGHEGGSEACVAGDGQILRPHRGWLVVTSTQATTEHHVGNTVIDHDGVVSFDHPRLSTRAKGAGDIFAATIIEQLLQGRTIRDATYYAGVWVGESITEMHAG